MNASISNLCNDPTESLLRSLSRDGNIKLEPEESDSLTYGLVFQPAGLEGFSASLDYFDIEITDAILDVEDSALALYFSSGNPANEFCEGYVRDASGIIAESISIPRNVALQESEGVDLQLQYAIDTPSLALLNGHTYVALSLYGSKYLTNGSKSSPGTPFFDFAGYFGFACDFSSFGTLPEYKLTTRLSYGTGPLLTSLRWRWIDGMDNSSALEADLLQQPEPVLAIPKVGSKNYFDLSATFQVTDNFRIYGGVNNLFDTDPPLLAGQAPGINTDQPSYDVIGRRYFLGMTYRR